VSARHKVRALGAVVPLLWLAACGGPASSEPDDAVTAKLPPVETSEQTALGPFPSAGLARRLPANTAAPDLPAAGTAAGPPPAPPSLASSRYTSLEPASCTPVAGDAPDGAAGRRRCAGAINYALETNHSDAQQGLAIIAPDGRRDELTLARPGINARLGKMAEWRRDDAGRPRALIVRVDAAPNSPAGARVSDLIVARLTAPSCIVAVIPRGPGQNEKARAAADSERLDCMNQ